MVGLLKGALLCLITVVLISCATTSGVPSGGTPDAYMIDGIAPFEQERLMCGPAALASVLTYHGIKTSPSDVASTMDVEGLGGTLAIDLMLYAKSKGLVARYYRGSIDELKASIRAGLPPIIFVDYGLAMVRMGHFMVVKGYDDGRGGVVVLSGRLEPEFITYKRLDRIWKRTGYATLLIEPAD